MSRLAAITFIMIFINLADSFGIGRTYKPDLMLPTGHTGGITSIEFSPDGRYILTASLYGTSKIWETETGRLLHNLVGHSDGVVSAEFSPNGKYIVTASEDKTAIIWETLTGQLLHKLIGHKKCVNIAKFSLDGKLIFTGSRDGTVIVWEVSTGLLVNNLDVANAVDNNEYKISSERYDYEQRGVSSIQFSPDSNYILIASSDCRARLYDARFYNLIYVTPAIPDSSLSNLNPLALVEFSPNSQYFTFTCDFNGFKIYETNTGKFFEGLKYGNNHEYHVTSTKFSPSGKFLMITIDDNTHIIYDFKSLKRINLFNDNEIISRYGDKLWKLPNSPQFSKDENSIAMTDNYGGLRMWSLDSGNLLCNHIVPYIIWNLGNPVLKFSPNGKFILTTGGNSKVFLWNASTKDISSCFESQISNNPIFCTAPA